MIVVKHRWMKNRNQRFGNTNLSFNNEGIAHVADVGNARLDVEGYVRHSKGLAEIIDPTATKAPEPPKPPKPPKPLEPEPPKEEEAVVEIMEGLEPEEVVEVLEKKPKKDTKKPPGKKSSSNKKK